MKSKCRIIDHSFSPEGKMRIALELSEKRDIAELMEKDLDMDLKIYRNKRSLQANRMMWACLGELAEKLRTTKDEIHDIMLQRYGTFTTQQIRPQEAVLNVLRVVWEGLVEDKGIVYVNGEEWRQVLLIYPSRYYDTRAFHRLLEGILDEMHQCGLETPEEARIRDALEEYERVKPWRSQSSKEKNTADCAAE